VWADTREAVVSEAAESTVFHSGAFQGAATEGVKMLACYARRHLRFTWGVAVGGWDRKFEIVVSKCGYVDTTKCQRC
jgi:hypothetical protein